MPDTTSLDLGGAQGGGGKGIPGWLLVVGSVAGIAGLVLLIKNQGNSGTVAAGTSINAALGSIQEENMNLLGTTQKGFGDLTNTVSAGFNNQSDIAKQYNANILASIANEAANNQAGFTNLQGLLGSLESQMNAQFANLSNQLGAFSGESNRQFTALTSLIQSGQASQAQVNSQTNALLQSIQQDVNSGLVSQNQANDLLNSIQTFQIWEFYQIPGRYSAFVPEPYQSAGTGTH